MKKLILILLCLLPFAIYFNQSQKKPERVKVPKKALYEKRIEENVLKSFLSEMKKLTLENLNDESREVCDELLKIIDQIDFSKKYESTQPQLSYKETKELSNQIKTWLLESKYEKVDDKLQELLESHQENTNGIHVYACMYYSIPEEIEIIEQFNDWIKTNPNSTHAYTYRALWYKDEAWRKRGNGWADTVTEDGWKGFEHYLNLSKKDFLKAYKLDPRNHVVCERIFTVLMGQSAPYAEKIEWFRRGVESNYHNINLYCRLEYSLASKWGGDDDIIMPLYLHMALNPHFKGRSPARFAYKLMDNNSADLRKWDSELSKIVEYVFLNYIDEYPRSAGAHNTLAHLAWDQRRRKAAIEHLDNALKLDSVDYIYKSRGEFHEAMGNKDKAFLDFKAALEIDPTSSSILKELAYMNINWKKDYDAALQCCEQVLKYEPHSTYAKRLKGDCYRLKGENEMAITIYSDALNTRNDDAYALFNRGWAKFNLGQKEDAEVDFQKAIKIESGLKQKYHSIVLAVQQE